jgi:hypothetical protein
MVNVGGVYMDKIRKLLCTQEFTDYLMEFKQKKGLSEADKLTADLKVELVREIAYFLCVQIDF